MLFRSQFEVPFDTGGLAQIAFILEKRCETIRDWFTNWEQEGLSGLGIKPGRGLKPRLDLTNTDLVAEIKKKSKNSHLNS